VDFVQAWSDKTEQPAEKFVGWLGIARGKFFDWKKRYGKANEHNALVPRDFWIEDWERKAIVDFHDINPLEGYRRLTFMMLDQNVAAVSPATTYRVLKAAGRLDRWNRSPSKKGTGFVQPLKAHDHWHVDISYINVAGTFFYLCSVLDGYSRMIVHWDIRSAMTELDVECIVQRAREKYPDARPRIISDNGPQFIAKDFKEFIRITGMTHVRTSRNYPQSNGKLERWHKTLKSDAIRVKRIEDLEEARRVIGAFVEHYNSTRLHSAIGYVAPADCLAGRSKEIWAARDLKLEAAREQRRKRRQAARSEVTA
jgi:transposase InsO family protein